MDFLALAERAVKRIEALPATAVHIIVAVILVGLLRGFLEVYVMPQSSSGTFYSALPFIHLIAFYAGIFFLFFAGLRFLLPNARASLGGVVFFGIFAGLLPPIIDFILPAPNLYYTYFFEFSWHLFAPEQPIGESITLWIVIVATGLYAGIKARNLWYLIWGMLLAYGIMQFGGWVTAVWGIGLFNAIADSLGLAGPVGSESAFLKTLLLGKMVFAYVWIAVALVAFGVCRPQVAAAILKRWPYALIWGVLVLLGATVGNGIDVYVCLKALVFVAAFILMQAENDYYDKELDTITGRASVITKDDLLLVRFFMALLVAASLFFEPFVGVLLAIAFLISFLYSHQAFRLKRHFVSASLLETAYAFVTLLAGFYSFVPVVPTPLIGALAVVAFGVGIFANVRDFKDFTGDKKGGIRTLYTAAALRGMSPCKTHILVVSGMLVVLNGALAWYILWVHASPFLTLSAGLLIFSGAFSLGTLRNPQTSTALAVLHATLALFFITLFVLPLFF